MNYSIKTSIINRFLFILLLNLILLFTLLSCSGDDRADWTILVYMAADNNLSQQAVQDIIEMEEAKIPSSVNVIVQLDPNQQHTDPQARRYKIKHNTYPAIGSPVLEYLGEIDSGDYRNLADFVDWGVDNYPADRYALIIWSHGSSWSREEEEDSRWICLDTHSMSQMSIAGGDFKKAFQLFPRRMDILLMDACFMQTIEVITEVHQFNSYIIASMNSVPYEGFPYKEVLELWNITRSARYLSMNIVEEYIKAHKPGGSQNPHGSQRNVACSAAQTAKLSHFLDLIRDFSRDWHHIAGSDEVKTARENSHAFNYPLSDIDLRDFFTHLAEQTDSQELNEDIGQILTAIENLFIADASLNLPPNTGTASIWFPDRDYNFLGSQELYSNLDFAQTEWLIFLENYFLSDPEE